ncbi:interferon alpha/beta receptor 1b-like [Odontesthes bonariensis]|uniref:interferon alpha/beta receptor 1b-like n=1 Tax=Odontesthes bonariensis TaxID=219752 RepID=UPI003F58C419
MLVVVSACLLLWCHRSAAVEAELAPPSMLTMITLNTHYTMSWEWDQRAAESDAVTFTTQYVAKYKLRSKKGPNWSKMCNETSERSCDLTALNLHYLGIYMLRVRASVNGQHSVWVQKEFCPDKDARVGPPASVNLSPADRSLEVLISDPLTSTNGSMKEHLPKLYYSILYWDRSVETEAVSPQTLSSSVSTVTLSELKAWTWYCVAVQTRYDFYNKSSAFTPPHCMQTEGAIPWWYIFVCFLASLMIWFLGSLLSIYGSFWCFRSYKATFFPQLPPSLKEYIDGSPGSGIPHHLDSDSQLELLCENVTVCPQPAILEVPSAQAEAFPAPTPDLDPDSSGRHSRQDSSTSGDSGVYSTGGTSGALLPSINQCFTSTGDGWTGPLDPERVKMHTRVDVQSTSEDRIQTDAGLLEMCSMPVIHVS